MRVFVGFMLHFVIVQTKAQIEKSPNIIYILGMK